MVPSGHINNFNSNQHLGTLEHQEATVSDFDILAAHISEQLEHQTDVCFNRAFWHGADAMETPCTKPGCPCGESNVEGPPEQQFKGIIQ